MAIPAEKQKAREQWSADPAGAIYGREDEFGTREFFDEVERHRYQDYAPWMPEVMGFGDFAGRRLLEVGCGMGTDLLQFARGGAPSSIERHTWSATMRTASFELDMTLKHVLLRSTQGPSDGICSRGRQMI